MRGKVGAASVVLRRSGGVSSLDGIYHYMMCAGMIIATSDTVPKPELKDRAQMNFIAGKEC